MPTTKIKFAGARGRLSQSTKAWAVGMKARDDIPGSVLILVELARDAASLADAARIEGDGRLYLSAASRLQQLVDVAERRANVGRSDPVGDGGESGGGDDWSREFAALVQSSPTLGDSANA